MLNQPVAVSSVSHNNVIIMTSICVKTQSGLANTRFIAPSKCCRGPNRQSSTTMVCVLIHTTPPPLRILTRSCATAIWARRCLGVSFETSIEQLINKAPLNFLAVGEIRHTPFGCPLILWVAATPYEQHSSCDYTPSEIQRKRQIVFPRVSHTYHSLCTSCERADIKFPRSQFSEYGHAHLNVRILATQDVHRTLMSNLFDARTQREWLRAGDILVDRSMTGKN